ncbi:MAG: OmpA family protein [bacterium]|nr:OmpA family protein [bacterium]
MSRLKLLLSGFVVLLALALVFFFRQGPVTEADLNERARYVLDAEGMSWADVSVDGGDLRLTGTAPTEAMRAKAAYVLGQLRGVGAVQNDLALPAAPPEVFTSLKREVAGDGAAREEMGSEMARRTVGEDEEALRRERMRTCQAETKALLSSQRIGFQSAQATLTAESYGLLDNLLSIAKRCPEAGITIEGHTDALGSEASNMELSRLRAQAVADYLTSHGVAASRLSAVGYGESRPIAENSSEAGRAKNRRIEIVLQ